jgi:uncharacterized repeat protein (TIGR03803 family)
MRVHNSPAWRFGAGGVLYGTTKCSLNFNGNVFSMAPPTSPGGAWTYTALHSFVGFPSDGALPTAPVAIGGGGVLYGTTSIGGNSATCFVSPKSTHPSGCGTVFQLTPPATAGGPWTESVLYNLAGSEDGPGPNAVVIGRGGVLYGSTYLGGTGACFDGCGSVFSLTPPASPGGTWTEAVLGDFAGGSDGANPSAVAIGSGGVLYGTTNSGGASIHGTVFSLAPPASPGGAWTYATLHSFAGLAGDGAAPTAPVVIGKGGLLYGTTTEGGPANAGTLFRLAPPASPGGAWTETVLHRFTGGDDGADPVAGLVISRNGALYGTTSGGGASGAGTVFVLRP